MKGYQVLVIALVGSALLLTGCKDSDKKDDPAPSTTTAPSGGGGTGNTGNTQPPPPPAPSANEQFATRTPSGLKMTDKFFIEGRGRFYVLECNPISGAVSYTFTTSFGATEVVSKNSVAVRRTGTSDTPFTFSVYATNADGINTRTASATVNN